MSKKPDYEQMWERLREALQMEEDEHPLVIIDRIEKEAKEDE